jgi:FMN phosphatase YigB (HAD superfamily)
MSPSKPVVFLLDVDNTLLDNDRVTSDLKEHLLRAFGPERQECYWTIFERLRAELGYADYLGALQSYRVQEPRDPHLLELSSFLLEYPFAERLYPGALGVIQRLGAWGPTVILSDGDVVFQPRKVRRSGLFEAVRGRVLIYIHKERELDDVTNRYPARHYVLVDDKLRILSEVKRVWGRQVTTVFVRQGHYARDPGITSSYPPADLPLERVSDLLDYDLSTLLSAAGEGAGGRRRSAATPPPGKHGRGRSSRLRRAMPEGGRDVLHRRRDVRRDAPGGRGARRRGRALGSRRREP